MYVDQIGLEVDISLPLFPVPPCPAGSVFKYPLLTWGESLILHFQNVSSGGRGWSGLHTGFRPARAMWWDLVLEDKQNKTVRLLWKLRQEHRKVQVCLELSELKASMGSLARPFYTQNGKGSWGYSSVAEAPAYMCKVLGSVPSTANRKKKHCLG